MVNSNIEIRYIEFRENGTFKTRNILEETKSESKGKGGANQQSPKLTEATKLDYYFNTT